MPDLADLQNTLAARKQAIREILEERDAEAERKRIEKAAAFLEAQIAQVDAELASLRGGDPVVQPASPLLPPPPPSFNSLPGDTGDTKE